MISRICLIFIFTICFSFIHCLLFFLLYSIYTKGEEADFWDSESVTIHWKSWEYDENLKVPWKSQEYKKSLGSTKKSREYKKNPKEKRQILYSWDFHGTFGFSSYSQDSPWILTDLESPNCVFFRLVESLGSTIKIQEIRGVQNPPFPSWYIQKLWTFFNVIQTWPMIISWTYKDYLPFDEPLKQERNRSW